MTEIEINKMPPIVLYETIWGDYTTLDGINPYVVRRIYRRLYEVLRDELKWNQVDMIVKTMIRTRSEWLYEGVE